VLPEMTRLLTFQCSSVHGSLAAAYTSGALAAEFGPEHVRIAFCTSDRAGHELVEALLIEQDLADAMAAQTAQPETRLLGIVPDGDGPAWALTTSAINLERQGPLLVRALCAVLQARPHRRPTLLTSVADEHPGWLADGPLRAASILLMEDFISDSVPFAA
jgi:hypothetical protein